MTTERQNGTASRTSFRVGDHVTFAWGFRRVEGVIVEDRGPIGVGGRRLFGIRFTIDPDEPRYIEMPADEIQAA